MVDVEGLRLWTVLRMAFGVLAVASALLLVWVLIDDGLGRTTIVFTLDVVAFTGLYLVASLRSSVGVYSGALARERFKPSPGTDQARV